MEDNHNEELQALTQLVSYQLAINILPFDKKYSEFIHYGLQQVVRTSKCRVCLFFTQEPVGDTISDSCKKCDFYRCSNDEHKCDCLLFNEKEIIVIPIQTGRKSFGYIALNNSQKIKPIILASIRNFTNVTAITIENKLQKDKLEAQNIELSEQKYFFEQMFMQSSISTQILDADGWCERINPKLSEIFGVQPKNIEGRIYNIFKDESIKQGGVIPYLESVFKEGKTAEWEVFFDIGVAADSQNIVVEEKKKVWYHNWAYPINDSNGKLSHVITQHTDITERKKVEEELILKNLIFESSIAANSISDNVGIIAHCNSAFLKIWGYDSKDEVIGKPIPLFIKNEDEALKIITSLNESGIWEGEYIGLKKDSTTFNAYGLATIVQNDKKENIGYYSAVLDITKRKQAELALKENERKLHQLNLDKDRFISILGHDLKNPFNNILGFSEALTGEIDSLNKDEIKDIVKDINKSAQITNKLLEDILMWARTQQGKIPFKPQLLSFADICKDTLETFNPTAHTKNITINYSAADHINVFADADMLKTVLRNLVSNAIKFTNKRGLIKISAEQNDSNVTISVSDNGVGIPPENLSKLFDISEVLSTKGTAGETGTGLGLLLCKEFVEKHSGKIWVESKVGKGSDFKFTLPGFPKPANQINN